MPAANLYNAAVPGLQMPVVGIGTGGYGIAPNGTDGEYWDDDVAYAAVSLWLSLGGRRIDTSNDYNTQTGIGKAMKDSKIPRSSLFITSKIGPRYPLGYDETLKQYNDSLVQLGVDNVDLLLIHWPGVNPQAVPPPQPCHDGQLTYKVCRQQTWLALEYLFKQGRVKAIGTSNFEENHLQDILALKSLVPSVNQVEYHAYWHEDDLVHFCQNRMITYNAYASLATPDHMAFHKDIMPQPLISHPAVTTIANTVGKSPAQVLLRWAWQQGIVSNPRTKSRDHMIENMHIFDFLLTEAQMRAISELNIPSRKVCGDPATIP